MQLVRSNSRRFMPSQADEEAHQLSYLQKHLANILSLLAESEEGEGDESTVFSPFCILFVFHTHFSWHTGAVWEYLRVKVKMGIQLNLQLEKKIWNISSYTC